MHYGDKRLWSWRDSNSRLYPYCFSSEAVHRFLLTACTQRKDTLTRAKPAALTAELRPHVSPFFRERINPTICLARGLHTKKRQTPCRHCSRLHAEAVSHSFSLYVESYSHPRRGEVFAHSACGRCANARDGFMYSCIDTSGVHHFLESADELICSTGFGNKSQKPTDQLVTLLNGYHTRQRQKLGMNDGFSVESYPLGSSRTHTYFLVQRRHAVNDGSMSIVARRAYSKERSF